MGAPMRRRTILILALLLAAQRAGQSHHDPEDPS